MPPDTPLDLGQAGDTEPCREGGTRGASRPEVAGQEVTPGPGTTVQPQPILQIACPSRRLHLQYAEYER